MNPLLVFHLVGTIAAVGVAVSSLEYLAILPQFAGNSIFSWKVFGSRLPPLASPGIDLARDRLLGQSGVRAILFARLTAGIVMGIPSLPVSVTAAAAFVVLATGAALTYRCGFGEDGSDQMLMIVAAGLCAFAVIPASSPWRPMGLWFIAAQSALSYGVAGFAKLFSPVWRSGEASLLIFRTMTYSTEPIARVLQRSPLAQLALAWTTIAFECLFPLALIAPREVTIAFLIVGGTFHVLNAVVMGLNIFFWAFVAAYPAVFLLRDAIAK
jgi:hypothetical protein